MADEIVNSLLSERARGSKGLDLSRRGVSVEPLEVSPTISRKYQQAYDSVTTDETARAIPGSTFTHRVGTYAGFVTDSFAVVDLGALSAGKTVKGAGLNIINRIVVRHSDTVSEIAYRPTMGHLLSMMSHADQLMYMEAAGGDVPVNTKDVLIIPLPVFWSKLASGGVNATNMGLPTFLLNSPIDIEFQLADVADILANPGAAVWVPPATAAAPWSSFKIVHIVSRCSAATLSEFRGKPWSMSGAYDYQSISSLPIPVSGAVTSTTVDLTSMDGSSAGLSMQLRVVGTGDTSGFGVTRQLYTWARADAYEMSVNGALYSQMSSNISSVSAGRWMSLVTRLCGVYAGPSTGLYGAALVHSIRPFWTPFSATLAPPGIRDHETTPRFEGALDMKSVSKLQATITPPVTSAAASAYALDVVNVRHVDYVIVAGDLRRLK